MEAEKTVLGAILLDPERIYSIAQLLSAEDFYDPVYRGIYSACLSLTEQGTSIDFVTVNDALTDDKKIQDIGGAAFIADLASSVPTSSHAEHHAKIVRGHARKRAVIDAGKSITRLGSDNELDAQSAVEQATQAVLNLAPMTASATEIAAAIHQRRYNAVSELQANPKEARERYVHTGFSTLDHLLGGLTAGTLTILAARPAMGKSALALNIARNVADAGKSTLLFSAEMTKEEILDRIAASELQVSHDDIQRGNLTDEQVKQHGMIYDSIKDTPLFIDDDYDCSITNLRHKALQQQLRDGLDFLVIDYLQLLSVPRSELKDDSGYAKVTYLSRALKQLSRQLAIPILALCQLSRQPENRPDPRPVLSDMRDSGSLEQDADKVLMMFREDYYRDADVEEDVVAGLTNVFVRKHRNGRIGTADLMFDSQRLQFHTHQPDQ